MSASRKTPRERTLLECPDNKPLSGLAVTLIIDDAKWRATRGLAGKLRRAAGAALDGVGKQGELTILLSTDRKLAALNREFRGKAKPTNVLSFPASPVRKGNGAPHYWGDVAIAYGVTRREAKAAAKDFSDHAAHLVVHGILHLAGYDHETARDAKRMEPLETKILAGLGIADPYADAS